MEERKRRIPEYVKRLLSVKNTRLLRLHKILADNLEERESLSKKLFEDYIEPPSFGAQLADKVATFGGSWKFIILFALVIAVWMTINIYQQAEAFDPYPFILLNLVLSCLAAIQAPIIMMSQNRQSEKDRKRAESNYLINLKSELQTRELNQKMELLIQEQMIDLVDLQKQQLELLNSIKKRLETRVGK